MLRSNCVLLQALGMRQNSGSTVSVSNNSMVVHLVVARVVAQQVLQQLRDLLCLLDHLDLRGLHAERRLLPGLRWAVVGSVAG